MIHRFVVEVMPREVILDTQGRAVEKTLRLQDQAIHACRVGKRIELEIEGELSQAELRAKAIAEQILHNPLIENFSVKKI